MRPSNMTQPQAASDRGNLRPRQWHTRMLAGGLIGLSLILCTATAAGAAAAAPPTATTGASSMVSGHTAVLAATVIPSGLTTTYVFQYGPTTTYGSQTATKSAGSGTSAVAVNTSLAGLASATTYHFRVVVTNVLGTFVGADATFLTSKVPPSVTTGQPSSVTSSSAVVRATVNPGGKGTTYTFQYGPTTSYGLQTVTMDAGAGSANVTVTTPLGQLLGGTAYHYRVVATNADGTATGADVAFLTTGHSVDPTAPLPVVSDASASFLTTGAAQLNGTVNPSGPLSTWYFDIGLTTSYGLQTKPQTMSGLGARPISVHLAGLQPGATYHYRLVANTSTRLDVGPDMTFQTTKLGRAHPRGLVVNPSLKGSSRHPHVIVSGRLKLPLTMTANASCNGRVEIEVRRGNEILAIRRANLRRDCSYSLSVAVPPTHVRHSPHLGVFGFYAGNATLLPVDSPRTLIVRHG